MEPQSNTGAYSTLEARRANTLLSNDENDSGTQNNTFQFDNVLVPDDDQGTPKFRGSGMESNSQSKDLEGLSPTSFMERIKKNHSHDPLQLKSDGQISCEIKIKLRMQQSLRQSVERISIENASYVSGRSLISEWLDHYWQQNFQEVNNTLDMDEKMHQFVQMLLITGEMEMKGKVSDCHQKKGGLELSEQINAVLVSIKPGFFNILCQKYSKTMLRQYLEKINREGHLRVKQKQYENFEDIDTPKGKKEDIEIVEPNDEQDQFLKI